MPPKYYPHFRKTPVGLVDKRTVMLSQNVAGQLKAIGSVTDVKRIDYQDEPPLEPPKRRIRRKLWHDRGDYLFMLVFLSINILDAWSCIALTIKEGGYIIVVYVVIRCSFGLVVSYLIVFIAVYTKKTVLALGRMLPVLTVFSYLLLFFATVKATSKMRLVTSFTIFMYFSFSRDILSCHHPTILSKSHFHNWRCIDVSNASEVKSGGLSPSCKSLENTLFIICGNTHFMLSSSAVSEYFFFNIKMKYLAVILAFCFYGIILYFLRKEQPYFVKMTRLALTLLIAINLFLICSSYMFPGKGDGLHQLISFSTWPTSRGLFLAITLALPNISEMFISICATTNRLQLCTVPPIDCALMCIAQIFVVVVLSASNLMVIGVMAKSINISVTTFAGEFVPFITMPYFFTLMPISTEGWTVLFFLIHAFHDFVKELLIVEAIFMNIIWSHGMSKIFFTILHLFLLGAVLNLFLAPDETDINAAFMHCVVINLPMLTILCFGLVIYGVRRLEEDITFMTSSPPSEIMTRLLKVLPAVCCGLLLWGRVYIVNVLDRAVHYGILGSFISEIIIRLAFYREGVGESPLEPQAKFGPPCQILRNDRKDFCLETRETISIDSRSLINQKMQSEMKKENL